jgi:hypothetical protein
MPASTKGLGEYQALVHFSVSRERGPNDPTTLDPGADLVHRGDKVYLSEERAKQHLESGALRPWSERDQPFPRVTAGMLNQGKRFAPPVAPYGDPNLDDQGRQKVTAEDIQRQIDGLQRQLNDVKGNDQSQPEENPPQFTGEPPEGRAEGARIEGASDDPYAGKSQQQQKPPPPPAPGGPAGK